MSQLQRRAVEIPLSTATLPVSFWRRIKVNGGGCWIWCSGKNKDGYGKFTIGRITRSTHRWTYEALVGPIPVGLELDHLCRVRSCCNPDHLEAVTHRENCSRGTVGHATAARELSKTHCPQHHPYDATNTYVTPAGRRQCRICRSLQNQKQHQRRQSATGQ